MPIVVCSNCGSKNRFDPASALGHVAKCGKCGEPLQLQPEASEDKPVIVKDETFERDVLKANGTVLLDCWAPWCGPCRIIGPIMEQLAVESRGRYRIAKLNVDENPQTAGQFQIQSIPTMLIFKNGKLVDRLVGAMPKPAIADRLLAHTR
jgi:thioredoxin 2